MIRSISKPTLDEMVDQLRRRLRQYNRAAKDERLPLKARRAARQRVLFLNPYLRLGLRSLRTRKRRK